jgi:y4mF family transcriptional regulator
MENEYTIEGLIKLKRKKLKLTQIDLAQKSGVGIRFLRELERGKSTLRMDKVNQVLNLLGYELTAKRIQSGD